MGVTSVVPEFRAEEHKAKSCFQKVAIALTAFLVVENLRLMKEFKSYRGGVLVVRSMRCTSWHAGFSCAPTLCHTLRDALRLQSAAG